MATIGFASSSFFRLDIRWQRAAFQRARALAEPFQHRVSVFQILLYYLRESTPYYGRARSVVDHLPEVTAKKGRIRPLMVLSLE